ncbi:site-specific integrase [Candidatus Frankia nodulisporulans]|uniref:site-specific integrase n=2 Tax=Candidatus Frankia nodulisporulans TaxID=2060052 RepID=UPI0030B81B04
MVVRPSVRRRVRFDFVGPSTPLDTLDSIVRIRPSRLPRRRPSSSPRRAPESAASRANSNVCSATNSARTGPRRSGRARTASSAAATWASAVRSSWRTSATPWCRRGTGRGGPLMPISGWVRSSSSSTAHDTAERSTSQRADTVGTDRSSCCQRRIVAPMNPGVSATSRRRATRSATSFSTTYRCEFNVPGLQWCGAARKRSSRSPTVMRPPAVTSTREIPTSATSSCRRACAHSPSPRTVKERCTLRPRTGSKPTTTRISQTPGDRSRSHHLTHLILTDRVVGLRRGEALALRWSDFDETASTLRIERQVTRVRGVKGLIVGPTKSEAGKRTIVLPARCVAVLRPHRVAQAADRTGAGKRWKEHGLIFPSAVGTHLEPRALNTHLTKLCTEAGVPHHGPHALRHTAATMAYALGVDWKEIQAMLGHTMLSTTMDIYVDLTDTAHQDTASKLDGWFPAEDTEEDDSEDPNV